tara:strand:+ start:490 stop:996 length:507 start_codon:yes stop_codon:yes gene_type:complete
MPDYSKAKIYKIVCNITGDTYYGSTTEKISQRMNSHRANKDCCCKQIIERGDYHYGIVEDFSCENNEQLRMKERYYIDNNNCINKKSPITSKEERAAQMKVYREENKEEMSAKRKVYREANKEVIAAKLKAQCKEVMAAKSKAYYEANKEKISAKAKAKYLLKKQAEK